MIFWILLGLVYDNFLLVAQKNKLYQLTATNDASSELPIDEKTFLPISYDPVNMTMYWSSVHDRAFKRSLLSVESKEVIRRTCKYNNHV